MELVAGLVAALGAQGDASAAQLGGQIGSSGFENNYLYHAEAERRAEINQALWDCDRSGNCSAEEVAALWDEYQALQKLDAERDARFKMACIDTSSAACALAFADLEAAFDSYTPYVQDGTLGIDVLLGEYASGDILTLASVADGSAGVANLYAYYKQDLLQNAYLGALRQMPVDAVTGAIDLATVTALAVSGYETAQQQLDLIGEAIWATVTDPVGAVVAGYEGVAAQLEEARELELAGDWAGAAAILGSVSADATVLAVSTVPATGVTVTAIKAVPYVGGANGGLDDLISSGTQRSADDVNAEFPDGYSPPYTPGTQVTEFVADGKQTFVRVVSGDNPSGQWVMKASDIEGLSPQQIADKFALPEVPTGITSVTPPAGTRIRVGEVNPNFGGTGGGTQFQLLDRVNDGWADVTPFH